MGELFPSMILSDVIPIIIFILIFLLQLSFAVHAKWVSRNLADRFAFSLTRKPTVVEVLEKFSRILHPLNVRVNAEINKPARVSGDLLLVNKQLVYQSDLYTNFYVIWQALLSIHPERQTTRLYLAQIGAFLAEILSIVLYIAFPHIFLIWIAVAVAVLNFILSLAVQVKFLDSLNDASEIAADFLDLGAVEMERLNNLTHILSLDIFSYVLAPVVWFWNFIVPFRR